MQETQVRFLGREDAPEKEMVTHSSILAWEFHGQGSLAGYDCVGLQRVRHDWVTKLTITTIIKYSHSYPLETMMITQVPDLIFLCWNSPSIHSDPAFCIVFLESIQASFVTWFNASRINHLIVSQSLTHLLFSNDHSIGDKYFYPDVPNLVLAHSTSKCWLKNWMNGHSVWKERED